MPIEFRCPQCSALLRVLDAQAGVTTRCPACATVAPVPSATAAPPSEELPHAVLVEDEGAAPTRTPPGIVGAPRARTEPRAPKPRKWPRRYKVGAWLGLTGAVLALVLWGGYALLPSENWHRHESAEGGFAIETPCPLRPDFTLPGVPADPNLKTEGNTLLKRGLAFAVVRGEIAPPDQRHPDAFLLQTAVEELRNDPETRAVVRVEPITVSGFPGNEVEYVYSDGGTYLGRVVIAHRRLYLVVAGGRFARPSNASARRFLDTFEITDDTLVGGTAHARKVEAINETFRTAKYTGPMPCDPHTLLGSGDAVLYLPMDDKTDEGIGSLKRLGYNSGMLLRQVSSGNGVRGEAAYVTSETRAFALSTGVCLKPHPYQQKGFNFSVSMWYKVRNKGLLGMSLFQPIRGSVQVNVLRDTIDAHHSCREPFTLQISRPQDENWHHLAITHKAGVARLYFDGVETKSEVSQLSFNGDISFGCFGNLREPWFVPGGDPHNQLLHAAIDEVCLFNFALSAEKVGALAGRNPVPAKK